MLSTWCRRVSARPRPLRRPAPDDHDGRPVHAGPRRPIASLFIVAALALVITAFIAVPELRELVSKDRLLKVVEAAGPAAPLVFIAAMALAVVVSPIPNVPISAFIGMMYGPWAGTLIASGGAIVGAVAAFGISRRFGRRAIAVFTRRQVHFCDGCSERSLTLLVLAARLIPVVSFDIVSYGAGLSRMPFWKFALWSYLGMLPWTWAYTTFGATLIGTPILASVVGAVLGVAVIGLPAVVRRYDLFGLRKIMLEDGASKKE